VFDIACGTLRASLTAAASESVHSALRWDCFTRARSALEGRARCTDFTEAVRTRSVRTVASRAEQLHLSSAAGRVLMMG
jgi:pterin-4a-carbinolamine dehydratase